MNTYTKKYFFNKIEEILNDGRPIEEVCPVFLYRAENGLLTALTDDGNRWVGDLESFMDALMSGKMDISKYID